MLGCCCLLVGLCGVCVCENFFIMLYVCVCFVFSLMGFFYIGSVCMVFFNWLYVCYMGGMFVLCIEDMDKECNLE